MRLLKTPLDAKFKHILKGSLVGIDLATAWATANPALKALDRLNRRQSSLRVRALVGTAGHHTTPKALKRLANIGDVHLVQGGSLFHIKLYLFHERNRSFAWIGSANFTKPGFTSNEELVFETEDTEEMERWFERRWRESSNGDPSEALRGYCDSWTRPSTRMIGVTTTSRKLSRESEKPNVQGDGKIVFRQHGARPPDLVEGEHKGQSPCGSVKVDGRAFEYKSIQEAVRQVFEELQRRDSDFLKRCHLDRRFRGNQNRYIAKKRKRLGHTSIRESAEKMSNGWWIRANLQTQKKWELVLAAADIAKLSVGVKGQYWAAEKKYRIEVGF